MAPVQAPHLTSEASREMWSLAFDHSGVLLRLTTGTIGADYKREQFILVKRTQLFSQAAFRRVHILSLNLKMGKLLLTISSSASRDTGLSSSYSRHWSTSSEISCPGHWSFGSQISCPGYWSIGSEISSCPGLWSFGSQIS